jgi:hypothetical protein
MRCEDCNSLKTVSEEEVSDTCSVCLSHAEVITCWEPDGFITDLEEPEDFVGTFDFMPRGNSARLESNRHPGSKPLSKTNIEFMGRPDTVMSINDNSSQLFHFVRTKRGFWVDPEEARGSFKLGGILPGETATVALAGRKQTDILQMAILNWSPSMTLTPMGPPGLYVRGAFLSWGSLVRQAFCMELDIDLEELVVNTRSYREGEQVRCELFLADALENGAGYCRFLTQNQDRLYRILKGMTRPDHPLRKQLMLPEHFTNCDSSCYDCLRNYGNSQLHSILDWRLGLDLADLAMDSTRVPDLTDTRWVETAEVAARGLAQAFEDSEAILFQGLWCIAKRGKLKAVLVHPLWTDQHPLIQNMSSTVGRSQLPLVTVFDALRRPGWVIAERRADIPFQHKSSQAGQVPSAMDQALEDFPTDLHQLVNCMLEAGVEIEAGGDVQPGKAVIGSTIGALEFQGRWLRLLDDQTPELKELVEACTLMGDVPVPIPLLAGLEASVSLAITGSAQSV